MSQPETLPGVGNVSGKTIRENTASVASVVRSVFIWSRGITSGKWRHMSRDLADDKTSADGTGTPLLTGIASPAEIPCRGTRHCPGRHAGGTGFNPVNSSRKSVGLSVLVITANSQQ